MTFVSYSGYYPRYVNYAAFYAAYSKGEHALPFQLAFSGVYLRCYFFTPVYSSTVFEEIVVVVFVLSPTCV